MDKYLVELSRRAYKDLDEIFAYISRDLQAPETAKSQTNRIWNALKKLEIFPQSHQTRIIGRYADKGYRQLLIDNYIAIFKINEERKVVRIVTIQYRGRNM